MGSKYTKRYSEEFKRDAIALVASAGRTVTEVARELGISSESLRGSVRKANGTGQAGAGASTAAGSGLDAAEREELKRLRKLAADQGKTIEILKKGVPRTREFAMGS
ncbi:transposase [Streptomyces sp. NPDC048275]|uniref:transposase n=1 Tax=Streptomyces sp. NPDC048275 TaxID=3155629 RepID=UPI00340533E2